MPLFFAFNKKIETRSCPLYFEYCLALENTYPDIFLLLHKAFVVAQSLKKISHVPVDMTLKKKYNKYAKGSYEIIGFSRRKEAVCRWIRHDKLLYT